MFKGNKTVTNGEESITATDFSISRFMFNSLTNSMLIKRAFARAWNNKTGDEVKITSITKVASKYKKGGGTKPDLMGYDYVDDYTLAGFESNDYTLVGSETAPQSKATYTEKKRKVKRPSEFPDFCI